MTDGVTPEQNSTDSSLDFSRLDLFQPDSVSAEIIERSRKNTAVILQTINERTATAIAEGMGVHDSAVSRFKSQGGLAFAARLLAAAGLKVVPADAVVYVRPEEFK
jgi:hypothetical protein